MKAIAIPAKYECKRCNGRGYIFRSNGVSMMSKCRRCDGKGEVLKTPKEQRGE